jgi:hypothetical protein
VWELLGSGQTPALGLLAFQVVREQLPDLTPGEWLQLLDRLAVIDWTLAAGPPPGPEAVQARAAAYMRRLFPRRRA